MSKNTKKINDGKTQVSARRTHKPMRLSRDAVMGMVKTLASRKLELDKLKAPPTVVTDSKAWIMVNSDAKSAPVSKDLLTASQKLFDSEVATVRSALASAYGDKPVPVILPYVYVWQCTVTTGITAVATPVYPNAFGSTTEFDALALIFDEFRVDKGLARWMPQLFSPSPTVSADAAMATIAYDPSDSTVATSNLQLLALQQHSSKMGLGLNASGVQFGRSETNDFFEFQFKVPAGTVISASSGTPLPLGSSNWVSCQSYASATAAFGWLKAYHRTTSVTAVNDIAVQLFLHYQFRCRA